MNQGTGVGRGWGGGWMMMEDGACSIIDVLPAGILHARLASMLIQRDTRRVPCMGSGSGTHMYMAKMIPFYCFASVGGCVMVEGVV